jgi:hypothetical protein
LLTGIIALFDLWCYRRHPSAHLHAYTHDFRSFSVHLLSDEREDRIGGQSGADGFIVFV